ncbi:Protein phosphatase methylesterase 1 [Bachmanniomyces sp. S44760]|nr:Protein phosphatase methylesterase 1 [Bachmanniomyces sp. S44760]
MSDLQRSFAKAKLSNLPFDPPMPLNTTLPENMLDEEGVNEAEDGTLKPLPGSISTAKDDDSSSASSTSSTGTIMPEPSKHLFAGSKGSPHRNQRPLSPLPWTQYFAQELYLPNPATHITHHIYLTPPTNPTTSPLFITHHGAGSSGLSFAILASEIKRLLPEAGVLSLDARGHGFTTPDPIPQPRPPNHALPDLSTTGNPASNIPSTNDEITTSAEQEGGNLDLRLETLSADVVAVVELTNQKMAWTELPGLILVGHSLGGAVMTDVAMGGKLGNKVLGYAVLDVVEGSAIDALQSMQSYLSTRPKAFPTLEAGIEWHTRSRTIRNTTSARVSVPSLLRPSSSCPASSNEDIVIRGSEGSWSEGSGPWTWLTDLSATQPFWKGWFVGLSPKFLSARGGKLLLLAGTDRLDKDLMIGQMQVLETGKYQLQVFPEAGHFIQEDQPEKTAMVLADFYRRNDRSALVLPPKVGDLLKSGIAP